MGLLRVLSEILKVVANTDFLMIFDLADIGYSLDSKYPNNVLANISLPVSFKCISYTHVGETHCFKEAFNSS